MIFDNLPIQVALAFRTRVETDIKNKLTIPTLDQRQQEYNLLAGRVELDTHGYLAWSSHLLDVEPFLPSCHNLPARILKY